MTNWLKVAHATFTSVELKDVFFLQFLSLVVAAYNLAQVKFERSWDTMYHHGITEENFFQEVKQKKET